MATPAERQRRSRAHKRGDHGLCDPKRCKGDVTPADRDSVTPIRAARGVTRAVPAPAVVPDGVDDERTEREPGEIEAETAAFVAQLNFPEGDPRRIIGRITVKLARRIDEGGAHASAIQQFRVLLMQLAEVPDQPAGPLDGTRARRAVRRVDRLLQAAS